MLYLLFVYIYLFNTRGEAPIGIFVAAHRIVVVISSTVLGVQYGNEIKDSIFHFPIFKKRERERDRFSLIDAISNS